jgi:lipoic acid synthetase
MILGDECSRRCKFCGVKFGRSGKADAEEPGRVAEAVRQMGLNDVVITSVTRDDLPDGGAFIWAETIRTIHEVCPEVLIEVLVPDFAGDESAIGLVLDAAPQVWGHNLETVPSLYSRVRASADYERSLRILSLAGERGFVTKTSIILGLGEELEEVLAVMADARQAGCNIMYIGQYLQPGKEHLPVQRYWDPAEFDDLKESGVAMGFDVVVSAPLVRSSYYSDEQAEFLLRAGVLKTGASS